MLVSEYIVEYLNLIGVTHAFGVGGANIEDMYDALYHGKSKIKGVVAKHEFSAATMADGYARTLNTLGVVMATSGGGMLNLVAGIGEAYDSSVPVLALIGQPPQAFLGKGAFQDSSGKSGSFSALGLFENISKFCKVVERPDEIQKDLYEAVNAALTPPQHPVVLLISKNVQQSEITRKDQYFLKIPSISLVPSLETIVKQQESLAEWLNSLKVRPKICIIAGEEVCRKSAKRELIESAKLLDASVCLTSEARSAFPNGNPAFVGLTGIAQHPTTEKVINDSELIFIVGSRLKLMDRVGMEKILQEKSCISISESTLHVETGIKEEATTSYSWEGDVKKILQSLNQQLKVHDHKVGVEREKEDPNAKDEKKYLPARFFQEAKEQDFNFQNIMGVVQQYIPEGSNVVVDAGNAGAAALHYINRPKHGNFQIALGMGGMGWSFGGGIGCAFANDMKTFIIAGDGAFLMHGMELHTAVEYNLPIFIILINNQSHGMCYVREKIYYKGNYTYNKFKKANYGKGISAMFPSMYSRDIDDLEVLQQEMINTETVNTPILLSLNMDIEEIPPFTPFINEMNKTKGQKKWAPK